MSRSQIRNRPPDGNRGSFGGDDSACPIIHVDMDAFYASVELLTRPELRGKPVIIGGLGGRGVVLSATYEARALGVHSAMPMSRARRIAPNAIVIEPTHGRYSEVSKGVMAIFRSITPYVEPLSLDEAFLDISGSIRRLGPPTVIGELIRARVHDEQGITCSVGIAPSKFVAKLASTRAKPDGLMVIPPDAVIDFLHPLPVGALWGVGERTEEQLTRLGLKTVADLAHTPVTTLKRALGPALGEHLSELSWGRDPRSVRPDEVEKSVSNEETFGRDVDDEAVIHRELLALSEKVAARLRAAGLVGRTIGIKVRFSDFRTITRSKSRSDGTDVAKDIYATARSLYDALGLQRARIRLIGVRVEGLADAQGATEQLMFDGAEHDHRDAERAVDKVVAKYGRGAVVPGRLIKPAGSAGD